MAYIITDGPRTIITGLERFHWRSPHKYFLLFYLYYLL